MQGRLGQILIGLLFVTTAASGATADARLSLAAMEDDIATVRTLLNQGVDVNAPQGDGTTALHWAASRNDLEMTELFLAAGADVNAVNRKTGLTPLHRAVTSGPEMITLLVKSGAKAGVPDKNGTRLSTSPKSSKTKTRSGFFARPVRASQQLEPTHTFCRAHS